MSLGAIDRGSRLPPRQSGEHDLAVASCGPAVEEWRLRLATDGLLERQPEHSAGAPPRPWQRLALVATALAFSAACIFSGGLGAIAIVMTPLSVIALALRLYALRLLQQRPSRPGNCPVRHGTEAPPVGALPIYTILVPLYREGAVVGGLIEALSNLDYPADRLDVLLLLEDHDHETHAALAALRLPQQFRRVTVPEGRLRTKPRALNYGLTFAHGDYVVVYDAEDVPEPDQLRRALDMFASARGRIGCVQAQLSVYNRGKSWFTRQFTLEYTALFDALLPALERLDLPVPLGGTSNHFPRAVLDEVGGWDPYNVTEDADLGIRLLRNGFRIAVLPSTTWEEAPDAWNVWMPQRTRWLKGWMQTALVHTRDPARLVRDLGAWRAAGFAILMGGLIASVLLHPWFLMRAGWAAFTGELAWPGTPLEAALVGLFLLNFTAGYGAAMALAAGAACARGFRELAAHVGWTVIYWIAISFVAHRALWQLLRAPHLWEKTPHTGAGRDGFRHPEVARRH